MHSLLLAAILLVPAQPQPNTPPPAASSEVDWAHGIAESFLQVTLRQQRDQLMPLVTDRLWRQQYPYESLVSRDSTGWFTRFSIERSILSPEKDEVLIKGFLTGSQRKVEYQLLVVKKDGKWRVDAFSGSDTPESVEKKQADDAELKWVKQVASDYVSAWTQQDPDTALVLHSPDLKSVLKSRNVDETIWLQDRPGFGIFREVVPQWTAALLSPDRTEAVFTGAFSRPELCAKVEFQLRLVKEKSWRVLAFTTAPRTTPVLQSVVVMGTQKLDCYSGWLPVEQFSLIGHKENGRPVILDQTRFAVIAKIWAASGVKLAEVDLKKFAPVALSANSGIHAFLIRELKIADGIGSLSYSVEQFPHPSRHFHVAVTLVPREAVDWLQDGSSKLKLGGQ